MDYGEDPGGAAFWNHVQSTTGQRRASWATFSALFETFMRERFPAEVSLVPEDLPLDMVLRYAFDQGDPSCAAASEPVTPRHVALFLHRFGPMRCCLTKAARSLFDDSGCLAPWFHGMLSRKEAHQAITAHEATLRRRYSRGTFLFRYSQNKDPIICTYRGSHDKLPLSCLVHNRGEYGFELDGSGSTWPNLQALVTDQSHVLVHPVVSRLRFECEQEREMRKSVQETVKPPSTPFGGVPDVRQMFARVQELAYSVPGEGDEATRRLEDAVGMVREVLLMIETAGEPDRRLEAQVSRLGGDILWRLGRREESVKNYKRCLAVVTEAQEAREANNEDSSAGTPSQLHYVHKQLAEYYLEQDCEELALHHLSESMAYAASEDARQRLLDKFRSIEAFKAHTVGITRESVDDMLKRGIAHHKREEYNEAGGLFAQALRDARCIGEGKLETRALGNLATVDLKTHRIPAAVRRYKACVQLSRQLSDRVTERKILNYLVVCCVYARRWDQAKLFYDQYWQLAASEFNMEHLERLGRQIEDGKRAEDAGDVEQDLSRSPLPPDIRPRMSRAWGNAGRYDYGGHGYATR